MSRNRPEFVSGVATDQVPPATVGRLATRAGTILTLTAAPLAVVTFFSILLDASTVGAGVDAAAAATSGPLAVSGGMGWALHIAVLGLLAGSWILGAGLVLSGLVD